MTNEIGDRAGFLATLRDAVGRGPEHAPRPIDPLPAPLPPIAYAARDGDGDGDDVDVFASSLGAIGGVVRLIDGDDDLDAFLSEALAFARRDDEPVRLVITEEPECAAVRELLDERDDVVLLDFDDAATVATADLGITGARAAVALTGSIVVDARRAGGRTVSLLPPVHLAFVRRDAIVATPGEHWRTQAKPMPSNLVQITGPSRSADIELIITLGVHGPRSLWVGVLS